MKKIISLIITIIVIGIITGFLVFEKEGIPKNEEDYLKDEFPNAQEYHWGYMPITYNFFDCSENKILRINEALEYIQNRTEVLSFEKIEFEEPDISFFCLNQQKDSGFRLAEATPYIYTNTYLYAPSNISLYYYSHCSGLRPTIEIHEIMHLFGLEHAQENDWDNIMNPYATKCSAEISDEDVNWLKDIYG